MTKYKASKELPITSNTSHIFYVSIRRLKLSNRSKKNAKTLQELEIFRQKSWQNHTVPSQLNSPEYIVFAYHKSRISTNKLKSKHPCIVLPFEYIFNFTEVW